MSGREEMQRKASDARRVDAPLTAREAALAAARAMADRRPGLDELIESGDFDGPITQGMYMELMGLVRQLRGERQRQGWSLTEMSERSGLTPEFLSRVEAGRPSSLSLDMLYRYALALDLHIELSAVPFGPSDGAADQ